jgi:glycerol-3-phosphate acyltransferase PlsY
VEFLIYLATVIAAYLLGSIPTGYLVARARGVDIRQVGSGNIGATNAFRVLGKPAGILVLGTDALKGFLACKVVSGVAYSFLSPPYQQVPESRETLAIVAGIAVILGHNYTCWLKFKGGKGIATTGGVLLALMPYALLTITIVWIVVTLATRYVSLGSLAAAITLPFAAWAFAGSRRLIGVATIMTALAVYKHKGNIRRLLNGTENRFGAKKTESNSIP